MPDEKQNLGAFILSMVLDEERDSSMAKYKLPSDHFGRLNYFKRVEDFHIKYDKARCNLLEDIPSNVYNESRGRSSTHDKRDVTPFEVGTEWLFGNGPQERHFGIEDQFTKQLREHEHLAEVKGIIRRLIEDRLDKGENVVGKGNKDFDKTDYGYSLGGVGGVFKYIKDYSTLLTLGHTGNLAVTYLGSYALTWEVIDYDKTSHTICIQFKVYNSSKISSGTRPPVIGYKDFWIENVAEPLDKAMKKGMASEIKQWFYWTEVMYINPKTIRF